MLTDAEVLSMRVTAEKALPDVATVQRAVSVSDGGGGFTETWQDLVPVACRLAPVGGGEEVRGGRLADESTHILTVPAGTDVGEADRVQVDGGTYEVLLVRERVSWGLTCRCEVRERA